MAEIYGTAGSESLNGTSGSDIIYGRAGNDTLSGGGGADQLYGQGGADLLIGGPGQDIFYADSADSIQNFQARIDSIRGSYLQGNGGNGGGHGGNESQWDASDFVPKDWIIDPAYDPAVSRTVGPEDDPNSIGSLVFDLTLPAGALSRYLPLYLNNDGESENMDVYVLSINSADAIVGFSKETYVLQEKWDETINPFPPPDPPPPRPAYGIDPSEMFLVDQTSRLSETPRLDFGSDITEAVFLIEDAQGPAPIQLGSENNRYTGSDDVDLIYAGAGKDTLTGNADNDALRGEAGEDALRGGEGDDVLLGEADNDVLWGGNSSNGTRLERGPYDYLNGGSGDDVLYGEAGQDVLYGMMGNDRLWGGSGLDALLGGSGDDVLYGGTGGDSEQDDNDEPEFLNGGLGNDTLYGGADGDRMLGGAGNDSLNGEEGNDFLNGEAGNDTLNGGTGNDMLEGGTGDDIYVVDSVNDQITDLPRTGIETVQSSVDWTLQAGLDHLTLTGDDPISAVGNDLNNKIQGNTASNILTGAEGADTFIFLSPEEGIDTIPDFDRLQGDKIQISSLGFSEFNGWQAPSIGQFIYDSTLGALSFNGIQFAALQSGTNFVIGADLVIAV